MNSERAVLIGGHDVDLFETYFADLLMIHEVDRLLAVLEGQGVMMVTWTHAIPQATDMAKDAAFRHLLTRERDRPMAFGARQEELQAFEERQRSAATPPDAIAASDCLRARGRCEDRSD